MGSKYIGQDPNSDIGALIDKPGGVPSLTPDGEVTQLPQGAGTAVDSVLRSDGAWVPISTKNIVTAHTQPISVPHATLTTLTLTPIYDPNNLHQISTPTQIKIKETGIYKIDVSVTFLTTDNGTFRVLVTRNGTPLRDFIEEHNVTSYANKVTTGTYSVQLNTNDIIEFLVEQNTGFNVNIDTNSTITIQQLDVTKTELTLPGTNRYEIVSREPISLYNQNDGGFPTGLPKGITKLVLTLKNLNHNKPATTEESFYIQLYADGTRITSGYNGHTTVGTTRFTWSNFINVFPNARGDVSVDAVVEIYRDSLSSNEWFIKTTAIQNNYSAEQRIGLGKITIPGELTGIAVGITNVNGGANPLFELGAEVAYHYTLGTDTVPSLASIPIAQKGFRLLNIVRYDTPGTYDYVPSQGTKAIFVRVQGAGGGGSGGTVSGTSNTGGGGGGAGGYSEIFIRDVAPGYTVTVGAGGAGGISGNQGANGGLSSFTDGSLVNVIANGGDGGGGISDGSGNLLVPGYGGTASGGDVNIRGNPGIIGYVYGAWGGAGGDSPFGGTGGFGEHRSGSGAGNGYFGGGGGGKSYGSATPTGGKGGDGIVEIYEYTTEDDKKVVVAHVKADSGSVVASKEIIPTSKVEDGYYYGLPEQTTKLVILLKDIDIQGSTNEDIFVQLISNGSYVITGYKGQTRDDVSNYAWTNGILWNPGVGQGITYNGIITLYRISTSSNTWLIESHALRDDTATGYRKVGIGEITLTQPIEGFVVKLTNKGSLSPAPSFGSSSRISFHYEVGYDVENPPILQQPAQQSKIQYLPEHNITGNATYQIGDFPITSRLVGFDINFYNVSLTTSTTAWDGLIQLIDQAGVQIASGYTGSTDDTALAIQWPTNAFHFLANRNQAGLYTGSISVRKMSPTTWIVRGSSTRVDAGTTTQMITGQVVIPVNTFISGIHVSNNQNLAFTNGYFNVILYLE